VIFEYALNDAVMLDAGWLRADLLEDTLREVAELCHARGLPLLLLCLELKPRGIARIDAATRRSMRCYERLAERHALHPCVTLQEALGGVRPEDYVDQKHLNEQASIRVAGYVAKIVRSETIPIPRAVAAPRPFFRFVHAHEAQRRGPCREVAIESTVYCDDFLEISRGGASLWPGRGRVVGLMLRSTETAGVFRLAAGASRLRKTAQTAIREVLPKVMLLHYVEKQPIAKDDLEISMPLDEAALMTLSEDPSLHGAPAEGRFEEQQLEIAGVMFWSGSSWLRRMLAALAMRLDARLPWLARRLG
jgi:hypothetical protein